MTTTELIFAALGILIIIGGFAYGIYDSYFQKKDSSSSESKPKWH